MNRRIGLAPVLLAASLATACAQLSRTTKAPPPQAAPRAAAVSTERLETQRKAYEQGVAFYGEERYAQARKAWVEAVRLAPGTPVGKKAQANLQKVDGILKRLHEIERQ